MYVYLITLNLERMCSVFLDMTQFLIISNLTSICHISVIQINTLFDIL